MQMVLLFIYQYTITHLCPQQLKQFERLEQEVSHQSTMTFRAGLRPLTTHRRHAASCAWATGSCCSFTWSSVRPTSPRSPTPSMRSTPPSTTTSRQNLRRPQQIRHPQALTSSSSSETRSPGKPSLPRFAPGWPSTATRSAKSSKTLWSAPRQQPCSTPRQGPPETWRKGCGSSRVCTQQFRMALNQLLAMWVQGWMCPGTVQAHSLF